MIVGRGLLASAFKSFENDDRVIVFASGVSNSRTLDELSFLRETNMINNFLTGHHKLIYFSTVSVFDESLSDSPYIKHKIAIEEMIVRHSKSFIIFRLPIVVGYSSNPYTLTNYINNRILTNELLTVNEKACRYLIDVEDVVHYLEPLIRSNEVDNKILNVHLGNQIPLPQLVNVFEDVLHAEAKKEFIDTGSCYTVNAEEFQKLINYTQNNAPYEYVKQLLKKYYRPKA